MSAKVLQVNLQVKNWAGQGWVGQCNAKIRLPGKKAEVVEVAEVFGVEFEDTLRELLSDVEFKVGSGRYSE